MIDKQKIRDACRAYLAKREAVVCAMLGSWVSEVEPEFIYGPDGELLGLGYRRCVVIPFSMEA